MNNLRTNPTIKPNKTPKPNPVTIIITAVSVSVKKLYKSSNSGCLRCA